MAHLKCAAWGAGVANLAPFFITIFNKSKLNGRKFAGEEPKKYICLRSGGGTSLVPLSCEVLGTANTGSLFFIPAFNNTLQKQGFFTSFSVLQI